MGDEEEQLIMNTVIIMQVSVEIGLNWNWAWQNLKLIVKRLLPNIM